MKTINLVAQLFVLFLVLSCGNLSCFYYESLFKSCLVLDIILMILLTGVLRHKFKILTLWSAKHRRMSLNLHKDFFFVFIFNAHWLIDYRYSDIRRESSVWDASDPYHKLHEVGMCAGMHWKVRGKYQWLLRRPRYLLLQCTNEVMYMFYALCR